VALAIALIIDPLLVTRAPPAEEPLPPPPPPPPTYPPEPRPTELQPPELQPPPPAPTTEARAPEPLVPPPPAPEPPRSVNFLLGAGVAGTLFQVPTPSVNLGLWGGADAEKWAAAVRVSLTVPASTSLGPVTVSIFVFDVSPRGCLKWGRFGACVLSKVGVQAAWASGAPLATSGLAPELALGTEPFVDLFLTEVVRLRFVAGAQLNFALASLRVAGVEAYRTPVGTIWLGLDAAFRATGP
jgi:hypothetical protein